MDIYSFLLASLINLLILMSNEVLVNAQSKPTFFNLMDFGAAGDGFKDDTPAFVKAWDTICATKSRSAVLHIPRKAFLVKPINLQGPCNSTTINIEVSGRILAPNSLSDYPNPTPRSWLHISNVDGLFVNGSGTIDGRGQVWWNTCQGNVCPQRPASITFESCNNLNLRSLRFLNSPGNHISIIGCNGVVIVHLIIQAPANSINTDGIDISFSSGISIRKSVITTGDDCVAIFDNSHDINITNVNCGPGHGISIGSLGRGGGRDTVENVHVWNCTFKDTQNGARIKTWQGGQGYARNIIFEDITLVNASNPIIIDQFYCPQQHCANQTNAVKISDVAFRRVHGTSNSEKAIVLHCSQSIGCTNVQIENANIKSSYPGKKVSADCFNAHVQTGGSVNVPSLTNCY